MRGMNNIKVGEATTEKINEKNQGKQEVKQVEVNNGKKMCNQTMKPTNILHPTTKTLTPNTTTIPIPLNTKPPNPKEYTNIKKDTTISPKRMIPETPLIRNPKPANPNTTLDLIPFVDLVKMVNDTNTSSSIAQNTQKNPTHVLEKDPIFDDQQDKNHHKPNPEACIKHRTWNRLPLKTPKVEREVVIMGKRNTKDRGGITDSMFLEKKR